MKALKYRIVLKKDPDEGVYIVSVPSLPGCHTFGKTVEEAIEMAKEAIEGISELSMISAKKFQPKLRNRVTQRLTERYIIQKSHLEDVTFCVDSIDFVEMFFVAGTIP